MLKLKKIAVTGGLSAGKTTVCQIFKELGSYVINADEIVHQLLSLKTVPGQQVVNLLGSDVVIEGEIDRRKIAAKVFCQPDLLAKLEGILHPAVFDEIEKKYRQASEENKYPLLVAEIPLLYETGSEKKFDAIISVVSSQELCRERFSRSNPAQEFDKRMKRQISPKNKSQKAHYVIQNNGSLEELKENAKTLYLQLTQERNCNSL